jgi:hypothetical protein
MRRPTIFLALGTALTMLTTCSAPGGVPDAGETGDSGPACEPCDCMAGFREVKACSASGFRMRDCRCEPCWTEWTACNDDPNYPITVQLTTETGHPDSTNCASPALELSASAGTVVARVLRAPNPIGGVCPPNAAYGRLLDQGSTLALGIENTTGAACRIFCWDFEITVGALAPGSYKVTYGYLSGTVAVP